MSHVKFDRRAVAVNSLVCVGLDSAYHSLPERFRQEPYPQASFNRWIIDQTADVISAVKPNMAFYEARGDQGLRELKMTTDYLRGAHPDLFIICDAKRADIDSTNDGYVTAIFDWLGCDAVTLNPYLGERALRPFLDRADRTCILLCRTSNPGAGEFQDLAVNGRPLWEHVAESVANRWNHHGNCMLVVGATAPDELRRVRDIVGDMTLLVPGIGAQGGSVEQVMRAGLNSARRGMIINASRSVIFADDPRAEALRLRDAINAWR